MARVKTFVNGGKLYPGDLNSIEDDYEGAFSAYRPLRIIAGVLVPADINGAGISSLGVTGTPGTIGSTVSPTDALYLNPADFTAAPRTVKLRLRVALQTNAVAPANTMTFGLYPVTVAHAASGNNNTLTIGTVAAGSTVPFATPALNTDAEDGSGDLVCPAAGLYVIGVAASGAMAAGATASFHARLQFRQV